MKTREWLAVVSLACAALAACSKGGSGEPCKSGGVLGPLYCDQGLICNGADGNVCEHPMSKPENGSCDEDALCASGLWCDILQMKCRPFLHEGDSCSDPFSCGPTLICGKDPAKGAICTQAPPDGGTTGATVVGTLMLPGSARGAKGTVALFSTLPPGGAAVAESGFVTNGNPSMDYQVVAVPAGTYFILGFVDVDGSGGTSSTPGDYAGWYGHNGDGNPPPAANAVVPDSGTVRFDFSLVLR
jgi:hypothetical protein